MSLLLWNSTSFNDGFSPDSVDGLIRWYDAADASTISDTGGLVDTWADKSSAGVNATGVTTARPVTGAATRNGRNVLTFDGADVLTMSAGTGLLSAGTIFIVGNTNDTVNGSVWLARDQALASNFVALGLGASGSILRLNTAGVGSSNTSGATSAYQLMRGTWSGTTSQVAVNRSTANNSTITGTPSFSIGIIGGYTGTASDADGNIAEILVYNVSLSAGDIANIEAYLSAKWGF